MRGVLLSVFVVFVTMSFLGCAVVVRPPHGRVVVAPPPPVVVVPARPRLVFIPEYKIYVAADVEYDLFYDGSVWFYFYDGIWYRGRDYNGPWVVVKRGLPPGLAKVPPGQLKKRAFKEGRSDDQDEDGKERGRRFEK